MRTGLVLMMGVWMGCGGPKDTAEGAETEASGPTWSADVRAVVAESCTGCHFSGGAAPFALETWEQAAPLASALAAAVEAGTMPPWSADPDCRSFEDERVLSDEDVVLLRAWADAGAPEGDPTEPIAPVTTTLDPHQVYTPAVPYTPDFSTSADDYRCQFLDHTFTEETWVTASQVVPGTSQVHHVLVFVLTGDQVDLAEAQDAADNGPGYTCFSGPIPTAEDGQVPTGGLPGQVGAWVPGANPLVLGDDEAVRVDAGARLVMQVHYSAGGSAEALSSETTLSVQLADDTPASLVVTRPLPVLDFAIPAGDGAYTASHRFTNWSTETLRVRSVAAHMHLLGRQEHATVHHADGGEECLLDIPDWDFSWQQAYMLPQDDAVWVAPGDAVEVACTWDNSVENQPVVDGVLQDPVDVTWGEGTADEMCLLYLGVVEPYSLSPDPDAPACSEACAPEASFDELLSCDEMTATCLPCTFDGLLACAQDDCGAQLMGMQDCLETCGLDTLMLGGAPGDCLVATCPEAYTDLLSCTDPLLEDDACAAALATCGL